MTDIELPSPPSAARQVVKVALDETPAVTAYSDDGGVITARTSGGASSFGELILVELPVTDDDAETTTVSVTARRQVGFNVTANPWKQKAAVLEQLREHREFAVDTLPPGGEKEVESVDESEPVEPGVLSSVARVVMVMLLGLLLLGILVVIITLL